MNKQTEAMKLALEWDKRRKYIMPYVVRDAIREALAEQPDKGPWHVGVTRNDSRVYLQSNDFKHDVRLYVDGDFADLKQRIEYAERLKRNMNGEDHPAQPEQEPVAYIRKDQLQKAAQSPMLCEVTPEPRQDRIGIHTSPPAQRTWVGLTDEDIKQIHWSKPMDEYKFARAIEAKLKEKNT